MQVETKYCDLEFKADAKKGTIEGYGSVFGNVDSHGDIVMPGAFMNSIKAKMPKMLWQHDPYSPIGVWTEAAEDAKGLYLRGTLAKEVKQAREAAELIEMGAVDGLSIGFQTIKKGSEGNNRLLEEIDLWEVSAVTFASNALARIEARNIGGVSVKEIETAMKYMGFSNSLAKAMAGSAWERRNAILREAEGVGPEFDPREVDDLKRILNLTIQGDSL